MEVWEKYGNYIVTKKCIYLYTNIHVTHFSEWNIGIFLRSSAVQVKMEDVTTPFNCDSHIGHTHPSPRTDNAIHSSDSFYVLTVSCGLRISAHSCRCSHLVLLF